MRLLLIILFSLGLYAEPMTVLFVTDIFPHLSRPFIHNQIEGLMQKDVTVYVMARTCPDGLENLINDEHPLHNKIFYYGNGKEFPANILCKADIVYCQFGHVGEEILKLKSLYDFKGKVVVCFRGADVQKWDIVFRQADLILPVCEHFKQQLISFGCPAEKILVHHSGIDISQYNYREKNVFNKSKIAIVSVGRLTKKKGFIFLVKAIDRVRRKYPHIRCFIVGEGKQKKELEELIISRNLENHVFLKGYVAHQNIPALLTAGDLFILSSCTTQSGLQEGIPNALMEAMAIGLPVISTLHSGIPELVEDGVSGFLVPEKDEKAIAQMIIYAIENQKLWPEMTKGGREKVCKEHNKDVQNDKILKIFRTLIEK